jgi:hypothetical protein
MTDLHDGFTSLAAHGKALPPGLTKQMRSEVERLVRRMCCARKLCKETVQGNCASKLGARHLLHADARPLLSRATTPTCIDRSPQATEEFAAFVCPALVDEHGHEVLRLSMGRLLDTLLSNMEAAAAPAAAAAAAAASSGTSTSSVLSTSLPRLMLYSGHDSTVMPLLTGEWAWAACSPCSFLSLFQTCTPHTQHTLPSTALGVKNQHWPPYISNLMFELWELDSQDQNADTGSNTSRFAVRVLYNSEPMVLPGASEGAVLHAPRPLNPCLNPCCPAV